MDWIKVENRLPNRGVDVLVVVQKEMSHSQPPVKYIRVGRRITDREIWIVGDNFGFNLGKITHWMPLPEIPDNENT